MNLIRQRMRYGRAPALTLPFAALLLMASATSQAQVSLYTAVDLALRNSTSVRMATADVDRARAALHESRDVYKPTINLGSGLGYSYGFPLGEPSVFNVSSQSLILSFSQPDYIRSARAALKASELALKDARQQVVLDTSLDYIQLDSLTRQMTALDAQNAAADKLAQIEQQRVDAGLEARTELLRARLTGAQMRLKRLHLANDAAMLRDKLGHLMGITGDALTTLSESIPTPPSFGETGLGTTLSVDLSALGNEGVQAAYAVAKSKMYVAFGDRRQLHRPQIGFNAIYSLFSNFNNYTDYYRNFQQNNIGIGISMSFPIVDSSRKDKAAESAADAAHATAQADLLRDQTSEQVLQLQKSLAELSAQEEVARLQNDLADAELQAVLAQLESGNGTTGTQLTPKDEQQARIQQQQRYGEMLDASFELTRARLNLMRAMGTIEDWAKNSAHP
ncbi:MAG TPA: TolC family protein [Acidisarcina sp.]